MKRPMVLLLALLPVFGLFASESHEEVWITIGTDAMPSVRAEFEDRQWLVSAKRSQSFPSVTLMQIREDQSLVLSRLMHEKFKRCGGYMVHSSYEAALAAVERELNPPVNNLALTYTLDRATEVNAVLPDLVEQNIINTITTLSNYPTRYYTNQSSVDAANWLKSEWESMAAGRSDISVSLYNHSWLMPSVVMEITGAHQPQDIIVMGGHLDSINQSGSSAPGADDDASGIATLTEILRAALANGYTPARTIRIIGYAAEEVGLRGSGDLADAAVANGDNIIGVLQLDMTNYNGSTEDIWLMTDYTNSAQNTFVTNLIDTYTGATWNTSSCGYGCSDHASWHNRGFAASMPFEAHINEYNPYIHTANDTLSVSGGNAAHAMKFARLGVSYMIELGKGGLNGNPGTDPGPVGGGGPQGTELTNGQSVTNLSGSSGGEDRYYINVPAGATNLNIAISGGSGDCDLYTRYNLAPTTSAYDCRPYANGNNESCPVASPSAGTWHIMLRGYSSYSGLTLTASFDPPGGSNQAPTAGFSVSTSQLTASFTDSSSDSDGTIASRSWNFGDGNSSTATNPSHTYASSGTYTVTLTVTDNDGATDSTSQSVSVTGGSTNQSPTAGFSVSTSQLTANFTDSSSDSDGTIASRSWNFGDGNSSSATNPSHTYASGGTYTVTLTVTDNDGASDSTSQSVSVSSSGSWVELSNTDFESGWGPYTDGGSDCRRSANDSAYAHQGTYCARLRDNSGSVSAFASNGDIDLSGYSELEVTFWYYPRSMESGEDFFVELYDGSQWQVIANYARGTDFSNNSFYNPTVQVNSSQVNFSSGARLRFRCDASGNSDYIYIDEVVVSAR